MRLSPKTLAVNAAVVTALVGGTLAFTTLDKAVAVTVDGETEKVHSFAGTVGDVLEDEGLSVGKRDVVVPSLDSAISDGTEISVRYARLLTVTIDGQEREVWTTALSVEEALAELGLRAEGAELSTSRSAGIGRRGLDLEVITPKDVTVAADGTSAVHTVTALTVREALAEAGIAVGERDIVTPGLDDAATAGLTVTVARVTTGVESQDVAIPFGTVEQPNGDLYTGQTKVASAGKAGSKVVEYEVTFVDGQPTQRTVKGERVTAAPVAKVVLKGTKARPAPAPRASSGGSAPATPSAPVADGGVWDRLAQCESGGNWAINTGNGYSGGLQFNLSTWRAYGGAGYPHENSRAQQIAIATKLRDASGGYGSWPSCASKLGLPR